MKKAFIILCLILTSPIRAIGAGTQALAKDDYKINWTGIRNAYDAFLVHPSTSTANTVKSLLPNERNEKEYSSPELGKTVDHIFEDWRFDSLRKLLTVGKVEYFEVAIKIGKITDAHASEELSELIGVSIVRHPDQFLQALEINKRILDDSYIDGIVASTYDLFVDDMPGKWKELERRYAAIRKSKVNNEMKRKCLGMLKVEIEELKDLK